MKQCNYIEVIDRYLNDECKDFSEIYSLGYPSATIKYLKKYVENKPERKNEVENIIENFDKYMKAEIASENFEYILSLIIRRSNTVYLEVIKSLLYKPEEEAIEFLRRNNLSQEKFDKLMSRFINRFPNQKHEISYLNYLYNKYLEKYNLQKNVPSKNENDKLSDNAINRLEILKDLFYSELSILEYCSKYGKSVSKVEKDIKTLSKKKEYEPYANLIMERDNSEFLSYIKFVAYKLYNTPKFDQLHYHQYTHLKQRDFVALINELIDNEEVAGKLSRKVKHLKPLPIINKKQELETKSVISGREIKTEEKEKIFNYLDENDYDHGLYYIALNRYVNGKLDLGKQYTLKK